MQGDNLVRKTSQNKGKCIHWLKKWTFTDCICTHSYHTSAFAQIRGEVTETFPMEIKFKVI